MAIVYSYRSKMDGNLRVNVECENCRHRYDYAQRLHVEHNQILGLWEPEGKSAQNLKTRHQKIIVEKYEKLVARKHATRDYGLEPCPSCGYIQSWMYKAAQQKQDTQFGLVSLILFTLAFLFIEYIIILPPYVKDGASDTYLVTRTIGLLVLGLLLTSMMLKIAKTVFQTNQGKVQPSRLIPPQIHIEPSAAAKHITNASKLSETGMWPQALPEYNKAIELDPQLSSAYLGRAAIHFKRGNFTQVIFDLREYIRLSGDKATSQAIQQLKELEARYPDIAESSTNLPKGSPSNQTTPEIYWWLDALGGFPHNIASIFLRLMGLGPAAIWTPLKIFLTGFILVFIFPSTCYSISTVPHALRTATINHNTEAICNASINSPISSAKLTSYGKVWVFGPSKAATLGQVEATSISKIDTLICIFEYVNNLDSCTYSENGKDNVILTRKQLIWNILVIKWSSRELIGKQRFTGALPSECPNSILVGNSMDSESSIGDKPDEQAISQWLLGLLQ